MPEVIQLILCPFVFHIVVFLARRFRRRGASFCSEVFRNFFVVLCAVMALGLAAAFYVSGWAIFVRGGIFVLGFPRSSYCAGPLLTAWLLHQVHQRCTKKVPKSQAGRRHGLPGHSLEEGDGWGSVIVREFGYPSPARPWFFRGSVWLYGSLLNF